MTVVNRSSDNIADEVMAFAPSCLKSLTFPFTLVPTINRPVGFMSRGSASARLRHLALQ